MKNEKTKHPPVVNSLSIDLLRFDFKSRYSRLLQAARCLKEKQKYLQNTFTEIEDIYNKAPCGYFSLDANGVFVRINDTLLKWLGEVCNQVTGIKKFTDILTAESQPKFIEIYTAFMKTGIMEEEEFDFVRKDGTSFSVLLSATAIYDEKGNYKMSRSVALDITSRKLTEKELRMSHKNLQLKNDALTIANEKLFFLNREKDLFRDIASHDLQLPLVAISMLSETLLKRNIPSGSTEEFKIFDMIHDASLEMKTLLSNFLSASLSESGHINLVLTRININVLTNDIINRYVPIAQKKNIQLYFKNNKNFILLSDRECCTQIIDNLISNAVKYTAHGKNVTVAITGNQKEAKIIIADEGPGIRKEDQHLLFQRFQKLSSRPTGGELSTGLGLSIVKYLVEQVKGSISVQSEFGKGSIFTVHLPVEQK